MKATFLAVALLIVLASCEKQPLPIVGTWKLVRGTITENGKPTVTDYTKGQSFIKVINNTHFAFMLHDLKDDADTTKVFASGGGRYTLKDDSYTEHLEYCTARQWEGHDFTFTITISGDTLIQRGVEKIEAANIDRLNEERYIRVK